MLKHKRNEIFTRATYSSFGIQRESSAHLSTSSGAHFAVCFALSVSFGLSFHSPPFHNTLKSLVYPVKKWKKIFAIGKPVFKSNWILESNQKVCESVGMRHRFHENQEHNQKLHDSFSIYTTQYIVRKLIYWRESAIYCKVLTIYWKRTSNIYPGLFTIFKQYRGIVYRKKNSFL